MILLYLGLFLGCGYLLICHHEEESDFKSLLKSSAVTLMLIGALSGAPWSIILALFFSVSGDYFLSRQGDRAFLFGLTSFAIAHLCFIFAFSEASLPEFPVIVVISSWLMLVFYFILPFTGQLFPAVIVYGLLISLMAIMGFGYGGLTGLSIGGCLFLLSDSLLAFEKFYPLSIKLRRSMAFLIWSSYVLAQFFITAHFLQQ